MQRNPIKYAYMTPADANHRYVQQHEPYPQASDSRSHKLSAFNRVVVEAINPTVTPDDDRPIEPFAEEYLHPDITDKNQDDKL